MEVWYYVNLPVNVNGSKWHDVEIGLDLFTAPFKESLGVATDILDKTMTTLNTTKSIWTANLALCNLVHIVGDLHQPLHTVDEVSDTNPNGDQCGNLHKFAPPDFITTLSRGSAFKNLILGSYQLCVDLVYPELNLTYDAEAISIAKRRIALAGKRLAAILAHLVAQLRTLGLSPAG
ncbi:hypothetical protein FI667_g2079, partial [Globisporangium splendens]